MNLYPNVLLNRVEDISIELLQKNKIKALILDVDNTLVDYSKILKKDVIKWANEMKGQGIKLYILSNTNDKKKVERISKELNIPYKYFASKPLKRGFKKIQKELKEKPEKIGVVGDQIFTDVLGGNRCKMFTILVEPINEKDIFITKWKRPIERRIKRKYMEIKNKVENKNVFK